MSKRTLTFFSAVVEMLASGLITLAHRSGGPLQDIVIETPANVRNGFLAVTEDEYADHILNILNLNEDARNLIRERAKDSVQRFSEQQFKHGWIRATEALINNVGR